MIWIVCELKEKLGKFSFFELTQFFLKKLCKLIWICWFFLLTFGVIIYARTLLDLFSRLEWEVLIILKSLLNFKQNYAISLLFKHFLPFQLFTLFFFSHFFLFSLELFRLLWNFLSNNHVYSPIKILWLKKFNKFISNHSTINKSDKRIFFLIFDGIQWILNNMAETFQITTSHFPSFYYF